MTTMRAVARTRQPTIEKHADTTIGAGNLPDKWTLKCPVVLEEAIFISIFFSTENRQCLFNQLVASPDSVN
ncbi:uncharacterized protein Bfra_000025 [Botrytis fragariae]|uniref:Uncharacterized protein n=1 Tax=Botrytis fragariae TaxID=1964551 RepID=A0A8H6EMN5_9HELO|nr:uncharacterized protein Bfra_000025 [Botrytis fragariae]KAF5877863.1 hypothetical protein Bfra_000025 [Botrytis fragariae]